MIRTISYKGKKYPVRIGYKALKGVNGELGREFRQEEGKAFDFEGAESLLFHSIKAGCQFSDVDFDLKREEMEDVLEESLQEFIAMFTAFSQDVQKQASPNVRKK
jgi:hypothetical protein